MTDQTITNLDEAPSDRSVPVVSVLMITTVWTTLRFVVPYAEHLRSRGWRVDAAGNGATGDPILAAAFDGVHELPLSRSLRDVASLRRGQRVLHELLETGPDIVHVHTPIAGFLTRLAIRQMPARLRPAVAYTAHGFHFHQGGHPIANAAYLLAERIAGRWTDRLIVINEEDEAAALRYRIVPRRRLVHMPGIGVDTARYAPATVAPDAPSHLRDQLGIPAGAPVFVVVGELSRRKRQRDAVAALRAMRHQDAHLVLAGAGPTRAMLEAQARDLGLAHRVHLLGNVADIRPVVRTATALILPSEREGLARCLMEALSLEVPVIASTARGNDEVIGPDCGILFTTGDVDALAAAMDHFVDHPDEAVATGIRGRQRMIDRFDVPILRRHHDALYAELLAERAERLDRAQRTG